MDVAAVGGVVDEAAVGVADQAVGGPTGAVVAGAADVAVHGGVVEGSTTVASDVVAGSAGVVVGGTVDVASTGVDVQLAAERRPEWERMARRVALKGTTTVFERDLMLGTQCRHWELLAVSVSEGSAN